MGKLIKFELRAKSGREMDRSSDARAKLISQNYPIAIKLSKQILKCWGIRLSSSEIESAAGIALCEAVRKYKPISGAKFTTYLHYFLKGALSESVGFQCSCIDSLRVNEKNEEAERQNEKFDISEIRDIKSNTDIDHEVYLGQIRRGCNSAIASLSILEKMVIYRVDVLGYKVANLAKEMGYSRGYLSEVRSKAERTLRRKLEHLRQVA